MSKSIKQIKKEMGIGNRDIADAFGYKNELSYNSSGKGKDRLEKGLEWFYSRIKRETSEEEKEKDG